MESDVDIMTLSPVRENFVPKLGVAAYLMPSPHGWHMVYRETESRAVVESSAHLMR